MNESDAYITTCIRTWVWSGFYDRSDVLQMLDDILEAETDIDAMRATVVKEFRDKRLAERSWPEVTDPDRLNQAFEALDALGICALQNAGLTQSHGYEDACRASASGEYRGYCFFHAQDLEMAVAGKGLFLSFGLLKTGNGDLEIGKTIQRVLLDHALEVEWDETPSQRILIPRIDWKRRQA